MIVVSCSGRSSGLGVVISEQEVQGKPSRLDRLVTNHFDAENGVSRLWTVLNLVAMLKGNRTMGFGLAKGSIARGLLEVQKKPQLLEALSDAVGAQQDCSKDEHTSSALCHRRCYCR